MVLRNKAQEAGWLKARYQLVLGLALAVLLPFLIRFWLLTPDEDDYQLYTTLICSTTAFCASFWSLRRVTTYPGVERTFYVVPTVAICFTLLFVLLLVGRLPYNRALLLASWVFSTMWMMFVYTQLQKSKELRIGVVPPCEPSTLSGVSGVSTFALQQPADGLSRVDAVTADFRSDLTPQWDAALATYALAGIPVFHIKHLRESLTGRVQLEHLSENSFGSLTPFSPFVEIKKAMDWATALCAGVLLIPLFVAVAIAIKLTSPGPVIFRQERVGYRGRTFLVYKFRTMTVDTGSADARDAAMTRDSDSRITSVGRFLRRSRIDELPQIINILRGEMSWIGPRPEAQVLSRWYQQEIPFYAYRHIVMPGLTGWAQVNQGHVTSMDEVKEKLYYDFYYIKNFSLWMDLTIINRTIATILSGFGAR